MPRLQVHTRSEESLLIIMSAWNRQYGVPTLDSIRFGHLVEEAHHAREATILERGEVGALDGGFATLGASCQEKRTWSP